MKKNKKKGPCWKGYEAIGMKMKGGRKVPNCVPVSESIDKIYSLIEKVMPDRIKEMGFFTGKKKFTKNVGKENINNLTAFEIHDLTLEVALEILKQKVFFYQTNK
jgi:hypothetical protein